MVVHQQQGRPRGRILPQALCTEASLVALRRSFPQIYGSEDKLVVDPAAVQVLRRDFDAALRSITPASGRAVATPARCSRTRHCTPACARLLACLAGQTSKVVDHPLAQIQSESCMVPALYIIHISARHYTNTYARALP